LKKTISFLFSIFLCYSQVFAGGFQLNEHGAKAMGMGGAFTAVANDPTAIYWNGAGLTQLWGTNFVIGGTMITPASSFRGVSPLITEYKTDDQIFYPPHFFASHRISRDFAVGLGFTVPFGLGTKWADDWVGKYLALKTELMVFTVSPVLAYQVTDELSVSAAFVYSFANVEITRKNSQTPFEGDAFIQLKGDDNAAFGYNLGLMYKPIETLSLGVSFHSQVVYDFKGTANAEGAQQLIDAKQLPVDQDITAELTTPMNLAFGVAYDVLPNLKFSADFQYVGWSSYDTLSVDFTDPNFTDLASPRLYDDSYIVRLGTEYKPSKNFGLLAGIYFDKNPVKPEYLNPSLPDANRFGLSFGIDYNIIDNLGISASYLHIFASQLRVTDSEESYTPGFSPFNGTYNSSANIAALSLSYGF
jgi:long-chain fatty acid transport protein